MSLHFNRVHLTLRVTIDEAVLTQYSAASPEIVGGELAQQVMDYSREHKLGYYPALDFFRTQGGIDSELLEAVESIGWLACNLAREEVTRKTRPVFSSVKFEAVQSLAFTMPNVRPGQPNALQLLSEHYAPNGVKLEMVVSLILKRPAEEGIEKFARRVVSRALNPSFKTLDVRAHMAE